MTAETIAPTTRNIPSDAAIERTAKFMKMMSYASNARVLCALLESPKNISQVAAAVTPELERPNVSAFLARAEMHGFTESRREGNGVFYTLSPAGRNLLTLLLEYVRSSEGEEG